MTRRHFIATAGSAAAFWPLAARGQQSKPLPRIGVLASGIEGDRQSLAALVGFRAGLEKLGWIEGSNCQLDYRWTGADAAHAQASAMELVSLSPPVILAMGTVSLTAMRQATTTIPIVFGNVTDPVAGGFVASLARPGGNITGFSPFEYEIGGKWLQLLKEMAPGLKRVALLGEPTNHNFKGFQNSFNNAANQMLIEPISIAVLDAGDIERGIRSLVTKPNGGLVISASGFSIVYRDLIVALTKTHKLPAIYWSRAQVLAGGLMSYGPDTADLYRQSATYIDHILKGAKPTELPVQVSNKIQLIINAIAAKAIDLTVPPILLARADEVIE